MNRIVKRLTIGIALPLFAASLLCAYKVVKWRLYDWLPAYLHQTMSYTHRVTGTKHVIILFVDHYEPGFKKRGILRNREWLERYRPLADRHRDSYMRRLQHTWFYAYDHKNEGALSDLAKAVRDGYGEVEFHWHHAYDSNESFRTKLTEGIKWFNRYGAMIDDQGKESFGFIHGNWSLDNSGGQKRCGVNRELDILRQAGCYGDFTFPALGNIAQPAKINSIYYAIDDDRSKSYNSGEDARVGMTNRKGLLIFQGPLGLRFSRQLVECSAIDTDYVPNASRADDWITKAIGVKGRPEWIFVKVYTHGIQGSSVLFSADTDRTFSYLEEKYGSDSYRLHYVTSREAYNIVRAAEDGKTGDPDLYRNYEIKEPLNKQREY